MSDKNFDVLLPIYDCTIQELLLTLESIRQQSFTNYRLIVINDGSEQHIRVALTEYLVSNKDIKSLVINNPLNYGLTFLNIGLNITGHYIA